MKKIALTVSGRRYEITLEDVFADFVNQDLQDAGVEMHQDNKPEKILKAYLRLAKQLSTYDEEISQLIEKLEK